MRNPKKWTDLFTRVRDSPSSQPRFSLKGVRSHLLGFHGYRKGDFKPLDDILELLESATITPTIEDFGNVGDPVRTYRWNYVFEDGSFEIYAGNYSGHEHRQGAFVSGFGALRSLLTKLRLKEPRTLKGERRPVVISLTQSCFDRMPIEMTMHLVKAFGHKAGLNPSPGFYQGPPIPSATEYYKRIQPPPREVKARHPAVAAEDSNSRVRRLIGVRITPRKGPLFYGMQLTEYVGEFDDGSKEFIANTAYELRGIVQIASKRARKGYKFGLARRGYSFVLNETDKKNVVAIVSITNDFVVPGL
jgi:hypothetical protein